MPPTEDANLLPSGRTNDLHNGPSSSIRARDRGSARSLDEIGPLTVLGAMVEQRRCAAQNSGAAANPSIEQGSSATAEPEHDSAHDESFQKIR